MPVTADAAAATTQDQQTSSTTAVPTSVLGAPDAAASTQQTDPASQQPQVEGADTNANAGATDTTDKPQTGDNADGKAKVPETYEFSVPEGVALDADLTSEFTALAKEDGLSQERAQKYIDLGVKLASAGTQDFAKQVEGWVEQAKNDPEFGGDKYEASVGIGREAYARLATPDLKQFLETTGLGNHPEVIRLFYRIGRDSSEERRNPSTPQGAPLDPATVMYPTMNQK